MTCIRRRYKWIHVAVTTVLSPIQDTCRRRYAIQMYTTCIRATRIRCIKASKISGVWKIWRHVRCFVCAVCMHWSTKFTSQYLELKTPFAVNFKELNFGFTTFLSYGSLARCGSAGWHSRTPPLSAFYVIRSRKQQRNRCMRRPNLPQLGS